MSVCLMNQATYVNCQSTSSANVLCYWLISYNIFVAEKLKLAQLCATKAFATVTSVTNMSYKINSLSKRTYNDIKFKN